MSTQDSCVDCKLTQRVLCANPKKQLSPGGLGRYSSSTYSIKVYEELEASSCSLRVSLTPFPLLDW